MIARAKAAAAAVKGAGLDPDTICCICKDDTPETGCHQGLQRLRVCQEVRSARPRPQP